MRLMHLALQAAFYLVHLFAGTRKAEYIKMRPALIRVAQFAQRDFFRYAVTDAASGQTKQEKITAFEYPILCIRALGHASAIVNRFDHDMPMSCLPKVGTGVLFEALATKNGIDTICLLIERVGIEFSEFPGHIDELKQDILQGAGIVWVYVLNMLQKQGDMQKAKDLSILILEHPKFGQFTIDYFHTFHFALYLFMLHYVDAQRTSYIDRFAAQLFKHISAAVDNAPLDHYEGNGQLYSAFCLAVYIIGKLGILSRQTKTVLVKFMERGRLLVMCKVAVDTFPDHLLKTDAIRIVDLLDMEFLIRGVPSLKSQYDKLKKQLDEKMLAIGAPANWNEQSVYTLYKMERVCSWCRKKQNELPYGKKLQLCSRCRSVYYCGSECQRLHWDAEHKKTCVPKEESSSSAAKENQQNASINKDKP